MSLLFCEIVIHANVHFLWGGLSFLVMICRIIYTIPLSVGRIVKTSGSLWLFI